MATKRQPKKVLAKKSEPKKQTTKKATPTKKQTTKPTKKSEPLDMADVIASLRDSDDFVVITKNGKICEGYLKNGTQSGWLICALFEQNKLLAEMVISASLLGIEGLTLKGINDIIVNEISKDKKKK